jgi:Protein of unknown function (DUF3618)
MSSSKKNGVGSGVAVDDVRDDVARTRADLSGTVGALADKADVKTRAKNRAKEAADDFGDSARRHPVRWGGLVAGLVAAAAAIGALRWRRSRTPKSRAERLWHGVTERTNDARKKARGMTKDAKRATRRMKGRLSR